MVAALPLDDEDGVKFDFHPAAPIPQSAERVEMSDYDTAAMGVFPNVVSSGLAGAAQWVTGGGSDSWAGRWKSFADERVQANVESMTPAGQRAFQADFLPSQGLDIWDENVSAPHAIGLTLAANAPDIILSMFTGAAAARIATKLGASAIKAGSVATAAAVTPGAVRVGGDFAGAVYDDVMESSDEELQKENEVYRGFRNMGLDEEDARGRLISYQQGYLPIIAAGLTAFTGRFGAEGIFKRNLTRSLTGGAIGRTATGALREGLTEGIEEGGVDLMTQYGISRGRDGDLDLDWYQALQSAAKGAAAGGPLGGVVEGIGGRRPEVDPDRALAASGQPINQGVADQLASTGPDMGVLAAAGTTPQPGATQPATPGATAPTDQVVAVTRPGTTILEPGITVDPGVAAAIGDQVGTARGNRSAQGMIDKGVAQGIFEPYDTTSELGDSPERTNAPAPPPPLDLTGVPSGPALAPEVMAGTTIDPTKDHQGRPLSPSQVQRRDKVGSSEAYRRAVAEGWTPPAPVAGAEPAPVAAPPVAPEAAAPVAPVPVEPAGPRVLPDLAVEEQLQAERDAAIAAKVAEDEAREAAKPPPERRREGERQTKGKAEREAAGISKLKRKRDSDKIIRDRNISSNVKAFHGTTQYTPELRAAKKDAVRAYMEELVTQAGNIKGASGLGASADEHVKHAVHAKKLLAKKDLTDNDVQGFMVNDLALRSGDTGVIEDFRKAQSAKKEKSLDVERGTARKAGGQKNEEEESLVADMEKGEGQFDTDESGADVSELYEKETAVAQVGDVETEAVTAEAVHRAEAELEETRKLDPYEAERMEKRLEAMREKLEQQKLEEPDEEPEVKQEPVVRERPKVEVKDTGVAGESKAGRFVKVEGKRRLAGLAKPKPTTVPSAARVEARKLIEHNEGSGQEHAAVILRDGTVWQFNEDYAADTDFGQHETFQKETAEKGFLEVTSYDGKSMGVRMVGGAKRASDITPAQERALAAIQAAARRTPGFNLEIAPTFTSEGKVTELLKPTPPENRAGTANTEARAEEQLVEQRVEENADVLTARKPEKAVHVWARAARAREVERKEKAARQAELDKRSTERMMDQIKSLPDAEKDAMWKSMVEGLRKSEARIEDDPSLPSRLIGPREEAGIVDPPGVEELRKAYKDRFGDKYPDSAIDRIAQQTARELAEDRIRAHERVNSERGELPTRVTTIGELLQDTHFTKLKNGVNALIGTHFANRLRAMAKDVPVRLVDFSTFYQIQAQLARQGKAIGGVTGVKGFYLDGEIVIQYEGLHDEGRSATPEQDALAATRTFLHESAHAIYDNALKNNKKVAGLIARLRKDVRDHYASKGQRVPWHMDYGLGANHEFLAEAMSNPIFQETLATIQTSADTQGKGNQLLGKSPNKTLMSVWGKFKIIFLDIIRARPEFVKLSALDYVLRAQKELDLEVDLDPSGMTAPAEVASPLRVKERVGDTLENAFAPVGETSLWRRRWALSAAALDHIRQHFAGYFPGSNGDLLAKVQDTVKKIAGDRDKWIKEGNATIEGFGKFTQDIQGRIADVVQGLTIHNLNVTQLGNNEHLKGKEVRHAQALAQLPGLQAQFDALPANAQKWIADASAYFRKVENDIRYERVKQALVRHKDTFTPQTYKDVVEAVMEGKLTDAHRGMLDDDALYQVLRDEEGFKRIKGLYFPLGRQGNYVVNTQDDLGDIGTGKVLNQMSNRQSKVVEWTAKTADEAEAAYKAYAESTPLTIVNVGVERRNAMGTKINAERAKTEPHTVSYRARVMTQGTYMFDSEREARKFSKAHPNAGAPEDKRGLVERPEMVSSHLVAIHKSIDKTNASERTKALMKATATDAAIRSMAGNRMQKHRLQRMGAKGASKDLSRTMINYAVTSSGYLAKMRHMPDLRDTLTEMEGIYQRTEDKNKPARLQILEELRNRLESNIIDPKGNGPIVQNIMLLSFLDKLASPMYSVVQGMQPWMVTAPVLGGRHGFLRAGAALNRAYNDIGAWSQVGSGLANIKRAGEQWGKMTLDTRDIVGSIFKNAAKQEDGANLVEALKYANDRTPFMDGGMELASDIAAGRGMIGTGLSQVDRMVRQLPMSIEAINRAVTVIAAYRLAQASGMASHEARMKYAFDTVQNTQGDYTVANQPKFFNNPVLRPALQFKKYAHMMTYLLYDMVRRARFEKGQERRTAIKQLMGIATMQTMMAGAMGLPGLEIIKAFAMVLAAFGQGEGYDEWEREVERLAKEHLGEDLGAMLTRGVIPRGIGVALDYALGKGAGRGGIDLSSRLSLSDMWTGFSEPKADDRDAVLAYFGNLMVGAPGSMALDWWEGGKSAMNGEFMDAAIKLLPLKFASDALKAAKGRFDETVSIPITGDEAFLQAMGARTGRMADRGAKIGEKIATGKQLESEKKELQREWMRATTKGEELKIKVKIAEHNKRAERAGKHTMKVYTKGLDKAKGERSKEREALIGG